MQENYERDSFHSSFLLVHACVAASANDFDKALKLVDEYKSMKEIDQTELEAATALEELFKSKRPYRVAPRAQDRIFDLPILVPRVNRTRGNQASKIEVRVDTSPLSETNPFAPAP